jgi:hypothetical protein
MIRRTDFDFFDGGSRVQGLLGSLAGNRKENDTR